MVQFGSCGTDHFLWFRLEFNTKGTNLAVPCARGRALRATPVQADITVVLRRFMTAWLTANAFVLTDLVAGVWGAVCGLIAEVSASVVLRLAATLSGSTPRSCPATAQNTHSLGTSAWYGRALAWLRDQSKQFDFGSGALLLEAKNATSQRMRIRCG